MVRAEVGDGPIPLGTVAQGGDVLVVDWPQIGGAGRILVDWRGSPDCVVSLEDATSGGSIGGVYRHVPCGAGGKTTLSVRPGTWLVGVAARGVEWAQEAVEVNFESPDVAVTLYPEQGRVEGRVVGGPEDLSGSLLWGDVGAAWALDESGRVTASGVPEGAWAQVHLSSNFSGGWAGSVWLRHGFELELRPVGLEVERYEGNTWPQVVAADGDGGPPP